eukprot:scaffold203631_cov27-Tisochrysis_lutea.AAC.2
MRRFMGIRIGMRSAAQLASTRMGSEAERRGDMAASERRQASGQRESSLARSARARVLVLYFLSHSSRSLYFLSYSSSCRARDGVPL